MGLISEKLRKGGEAAAVPPCSPFPLAVMLPIEVKNLTLLLLVFEHHDFSRQWIASVPCHKALSGESAPVVSSVFMQRSRQVTKQMPTGLV